MTILIICIILFLAIVLMLVELFIIPGFSFAGILAFVCFGLAMYFGFSELGLTGGVIVTLIALISGAITVYIFMRSKTLEKLALKKEITSQVNRDDERSIKIGDKGVTTTRLAQIGYAEINGKIVEVKTTEGLIDEKTPIIVVRITDRTILVEKQKHH